MRIIKANVKNADITPCVRYAHKYISEKLNSTIFSSGQNRQMTFLQINY